jgi:hypothetical protein
MSIDLVLEPVRITRITPLLPKISAVLADLLRVTSLPPLVMERLEGGERLPVVDDQVGFRGAPLLLLSVCGEPETVALVSGSDFLAVTISGSRSNIQYALSAATAIALAREMGAGVWDDRRFFGDEVHTSPDALLRGLKVAGQQDDYLEAAERIKWGPGGQPWPGQ